MDPNLLITRIITLVIAFTIHEFSHALCAVSLGDDTPKREGRLTINPLAHLDIFGTMLLITSGFGWAKPVHVNTWQLQRKTSAGLMLVSLAGPLSNLFLAVLAIIPLRLGLVTHTYYTDGNLPSLWFFLFNFAIINLNLMVFNLVPLAPLDGEKVLEFFVPRSIRPSWNSLQKYGPYILMVLFFVLPYLRINVFGNVLSPIVFFIFNLISGGQL